MHNYHTTYRSLPVGAYSCCWGTWMMAVLPYVEQEALFDTYSYGHMYDTVNASYWYWSEKPAGDDEAVCRLYMSERCAKLTLPRYVWQDYLPQLRRELRQYGHRLWAVGRRPLRRGVRHPARVGDVVFQGAPFTESGWSDVPAQVFKFSDITDGLSNTLMLAEVVQGQGDDPPDLRGFTWWGEASGFMTYVPPNSSQPDVLPSGYCNPNLNPPCVSPYSATQPVMMGARSRHSGGVNTAQCDGSVRFISNEIELGLWRRR